MKHVVITGADGFIGRHLTRFFSQNGIKVYAIVSKKSTTLERLSNIANVEILVGDSEDYQIVAKKILPYPIAVIHLAWDGVSPEFRNITEMQVKNIGLCLEAVRLASAIYAHRFIFPGSTMEYAYCGQEINETATPSPQNAYGAAKIAARYLCASLCEELKISYIYCVITGIYSADRADNNVIYYTIRQLLNRQPTRYTRLEQCWDYIHIDDLVNALYLVALKGKNGAFYSIGHGDNWPLSNYIYQIRDIICPEAELGIGELPYKDERLPSSCIDLTSLKSDTGFQPKIEFREGIQDVILAVKQSIEK